MWKFQGEVVCGAEEEREEVVQSAQRVTGNGAGFSSQGQAILSTCRRPKSLRAQVPLLEPCQPATAPFHLGIGTQMDSSAS